MTQQIIGRFSRVPIGLFRVQTVEKVKLREYFRQQQQNRTSFDFKLHPDKKIHPAIGDEWVGPNGMSLRPGGYVMGEVVANFRGNVVYHIPKDTELPDDLVLLHEHSDHYSMQTAKMCTEKQLNDKLTEFLLQYAEKMTKNEYFEKFPMK